MWKAIWDIQRLKTDKWRNKRTLRPLISPDVNVRQQRLNRRICGELVCWGAAGAPWGPPASLAGDSTEALPVDLHFAALAGKVVLALCSRLTALTRSSLNGTAEAVHGRFTSEHDRLTWAKWVISTIAVWIKDDKICRITQITYDQFHSKNAETTPMKLDRNENQSSLQVRGICGTAVYFFLFMAPQ